MEKQYSYINYQKSTLKIKCKNCKNDNCTLLYDKHHDQVFSDTCCRVIIQSNNYLLEYWTDPLYWEKQYQKRLEIKQKKQILKVIQEELQLKYKINPDNGELQILQYLNHREINRLTYLCENTVFELIENKNNHRIPFKIIKNKNKKEKEN